MKQGDKCILKNSEKLREINLGGESGKLVTLERLLTDEEIRNRSKLRGAITWYVRSPIGQLWYVPVSCLEPVNKYQFNIGDRVRLWNAEALRKDCLPERFHGIRGTIVCRKSPGCYDVDIDGEGKWWVSDKCIEPDQQQQSTSAGHFMDSGASTQTQTKKEQINMYAYKVRFTAMPSVIAQQAGEKETVVAVARDILAVSEHAAVAEAAADNAEAIIKVRDSKATLNVTVKTD